MELEPEKKWMTLDEVYARFGEAATFREIFYDWMGLNEWLFFRINHLRGAFYDSLMLWVTELGNKYHFPYVLALLAVFAVAGTVGMKLKGRAGFKQYAIRWGLLFMVLVAGFIANAIVITGMKEHFALPRPYAAFDQSPITGNSAQKVYQLETRAPEQARQSFPSGHVAFITLLVVALWPLLGEGMRYFGGFLIFAVAWSRVSLGVHFPADTVWSFLITLLVVIAVRAAIHRLMRGVFGIHC